MFLNVRLFSRFSCLHSINFIYLFSEKGIQIIKKLTVIMWPILMQMLRSNAAYLTLPVAAVVGVIGYNLESLLSDRYTPYNKPVQDQRLERLIDETLDDPTNVQKLKYKENVLGKNLSPSLLK